MIAPDTTAADFSLPTLELRSLGRRALVPALVGAGVLAAVMFGGHRIHTVTAVLHRALGVNGWWTAAAVVFECVSVAGYVVLLALVAGSATPRIRMRESAEITLAGTAATRLLPTAGAGGAGLTLWSLRRAGLSTAAATRTLLTFLVLLYTVFLAAIVLAGASLAIGAVRNHGPFALSAIPALAAILAIVIALVLGARPRPGRVGVLGGAVRDAARLMRAGDARHIGALVYWGFDAAVLWSMLHAFGHAPALPVVVLAYFVGQVANTLPLPGSVSGGIAGVLIAFGVPGEIALPAVLAYRTIAVWLPVPLAVAAIGRLRRTVSRWGAEDAAASRTALAHDLTRGLVVTETAEAWMPEPVMAGPFGEAHLRDELGRHPGDTALADRRRIVEGGGVARQCPQLSAELAEGSLVEPSADLAGVAQALAVEVPDEQRTELVPRSARCRKAADHEFLSLRALELQPVA
jgi:uncharacterized membrane protein YbhN (UPF0104 family)